MFAQLATVFGGKFLIPKRRFLPIFAWLTACVLPPHKTMRFIAF